MGMKNNLDRLLGYLLEKETVSQRPFMLSLDRLVAHRDSLFDAYEHCVYRNRCSESSGPIVVAEIEDGKYQLIDGYHRLIEHLLDRGGLVPIRAILGGEGTGEYAIARGGDRWLGDASMRYGNLEDLTDEETLEGHANKRKNAKSRHLFENGVGGSEIIEENVNEAMETEPPEGYYVDISGNERVIRIRIKSKAGGRPKYAGMMNVGRGIMVPAAEDHDGGLVWEVANVEAEPGYGPMLYDLAMEMVLLVGGVGLMPDRTYVSPSARGVWEKYYSRGDIYKEPLPEDIFDFSDMRNRPDYMRYYYSKSGTPLMNSLKARGLLKSKDFDLD
jgi:hypothetical protein